MLVATGDFNLVVNALSQGALELCSRLQTLHLKLSEKSLIVASSQNLSKALVET